MSGLPSLNPAHPLQLIGSTFLKYHDNTSNFSGTLFHCIEQKGLFFLSLLSSFPLVLKPCQAVDSQFAIHLCCHFLFSPVLFSSMHLHVSDNSSPSLSIDKNTSLSSLRSLLQHFVFFSKGNWYLKACGQLATSVFLSCWPWLSHCFLVPGHLTLSYLL